MLMQGCATNTKEIKVLSCDGWKPIYFSKLDTQETIKQIKAHNAFYDWCKEKENLR